MSNPPNQPKSGSRTTWLIAGGVLVVVIALVIALTTTSKKSSPKVPTGSAASSVVRKATSVPASVYESVGVGTEQGLPKPTGGAKLTAQGKPEVFFMGAEYCPFCATERWAIVAALSRFGTFSNLGLSHSSGTDTYPNTQTVTFYGASYTSKYVSFRSVELTTNKPDGKGGYTTLQNPTTAEQKFVAAVNPQGSIPFLDFGGRFFTAGVTYDPGVLQGKTASQIATLLSQPSSPVAKGAIGSANALTAAICEITGGQPGTVCNTSTIKGIRSQLS
ncbi:MAG TPA: DUF929 family protein [Acidimicrobiales bacterium]